MRDKISKLYSYLFIYFKSHDWNTNSWDIKIHLPNGVVLNVQSKCAKPALRLMRVNDALCIDSTVLFAVKGGTYFRYLISLF